MKRKQKPTRITRWLCLALVILMGAFCLASCAGSAGNTNTAATTTDPGTELPLPDDDSVLKLISESRANVRIVYQLDGGAIFAMEAIRNALQEKTGVKVSAIPDLAIDLNEETLEIIIGNTRYAASEEALRELEPNSYSIGVSGNKIVIVSDNTYLYQTAGEALVKALLTAANGTVMLRKDFSEKSGSYPVLTLATNLKSTYTIVYPNGDETARNQATILKNGFQSVGITVPITADTAAVGGKEILIGKTNRPLSANDPSYYLNAYSGCDENGNLAILGNLSAGVDTLINYLENITMVSRDVEIPQFLFGFSTPKGYGNLPEYKGGGTVELNMSFESSKSYYLYVHNATNADYEQYTNLLKTEGFECHRSFKSNGNFFSTWTDGYNILTISQISYLDPATTDHKTASNGNVRYMCIAVDCTDNSELPPMEPDIKTVTTQQITALPVGLSYILRLSDGRFVIFDGGQNEEHTDALYRQLCLQNVREGKPVIAAWMLTHGHSDHIEGMFSFIRKYHDSVVVENFVHNLPGTQVYVDKNTGEIDPAKESTALRNRSTNYYVYVPQYYPNANIIVAHAGQQFLYGDIKIDVLFTSENLYKKQMLDTNASSVVYSINGKTGRMIILGDAVDPECAVLNAIYEDDLRCDIVQVAHHGYNGGNVNMYESMNADYAIWANSLETVLDRNCHIQSINKRNQFNYKSVIYNFIPSVADGFLTLSEDMTEADLAALDAGLTDTPRT